jgi:hypothetical protein
MATAVKSTRGKNAPGTVTLTSPEQKVVDDVRAAMLTIWHAKDGGVVCPVCSQQVVLRGRHIHSMMALSLMALVGLWTRRLQAGTDPWVDVREICRHLQLGGIDFKTVNPTSDFAKLVHWKLTVERPNDDPSRRSSGLWQPSALGAAFVRGRATVPRTAYFYNQNVHGFSADHTTIQECLGDKFDYPALLAGL